MFQLKRVGPKALKVSNNQAMLGGGGGVESSTLANRKLVHFGPSDSPRRGVDSLKISAQNLMINFQ